MNGIGSAAEVRVWEKVKSKGKDALTVQSAKAVTQLLPNVKTMLIKEDEIKSTMTEEDPWKETTDVHGIKKYTSQANAGVFKMSPPLYWYYSCWQSTNIHPSHYIHFMLIWMADFLNLLLVFNKTFMYKLFRHPLLHLDYHTVLLITVTGFWTCTFLAHPEQFHLIIDHVNKTCLYKCSSHSGDYPTLRHNVQFKISFLH